MTSYTNFIGIDIGKCSFFISIHQSNLTQEYENSITGINKFIEEFDDILLNSLCVAENTGGYELEFIYSLIAHGYKVHRADARKVKNFIRSFGFAAKTDKLDAKALALYGYERADRLKLFEAQSTETIELQQLLHRRHDLKSSLVAEKNRLQAPSTNFIRDSIIELINTINDQLESIDNKIRFLIANNSILKKKNAILKTIPGIGEVVAFELLILLPELGSLSRRAIASLAGVAPKANDSGKFSGYRRTGHGRRGIKPILFLAAMAARNSKTYLKKFYEKLIVKGKKKMVALTALMRKILVIANARLKEI